VAKQIKTAEKRRKSNATFFLKCERPKDTEKKERQTICPQIEGECVNRLIQYSS
jgi:hypothetical protein